MWVLLESFLESGNIVVLNGVKVGWSCIIVWEELFFNVFFLYVLII